MFAAVSPMVAIADDTPAGLGLPTPDVWPCSQRDRGDLCINVNPGEGLWGVARRYQTSSCLPTTSGAVKARARAIYRRNRRAIGRNPGHVRVGQELRVGRYYTVTDGMAQFWHDPVARCPGRP